MLLFFFFTLWMTLCCTLKVWPVRHKQSLIWIDLKRYQETSIFSLLFTISGCQSRWQLFVIHPTTRDTPSWSACNTGRTGSASPHSSCCSLYCSTFPSSPPYERNHRFIGLSAAALNHKLQWGIPAQANVNEKSHGLETASSYWLWHCHALAAAVPLLTNTLSIVNLPICNSPHTFP